MAKSSHSNFISIEQLYNEFIIEIKTNLTKISRLTTRSNRRTRYGEPRGRFGGVRGKQPLASSPPSANRTPNLARRLENLAALDFQCCERPLGSQHIYRRHFSANPFGFAAQRGVLQYYGAVIIENWHYHE